VTAFLPPTIGFLPLANAWIYSGVVGALVLLLAGAWWLFGPGPRRARAYRRAQRLLQQGHWQEALTLIKHEQSGRLSSAWQGRLRSGEGECNHAAAEMLLREKDYEESLRYFEIAAELLGLKMAEPRTRVVDTMLADVRQQFAACKSAADNEKVQALINRVLRVQAPCSEATFWRGLCHVREGNLDAAMAALSTAHEESGKRFIDPPLYLGTLRIRTGQTQEGLRLLGEANRVDTGCPLVSLELGIGMIAGNGDSAIAGRALQRALGPRGLGLWRKQPQNLWSQTFPEGRSYIQWLAVKHSFVCPVFGNDIAAIARQGEIALAQAEYRQGHFQDAADRFARLLQDVPPSAPLLRGLGLSLARLERYDQAYKHLRAALDMEEPKDALTAGYLALCGALGRPIREEDKARNVEWAVSLLGRFSQPGNADWARISSAVFAEARTLGLPLAVEDQVRLCETLRSVEAFDAEAAAAYSQLAAAAPEAVRPEYAWLYCRAAQVHGFTSGQDLDLFGRTFRDEEAARAFFAARQWDLGETAYTYLERCAAQRPGHFPEEFGPEYPPRGEAMLLERSEQLETAGQADAALAAVDVLAKLAPHSPRAHDRLAQLYYRRGDLERTTTLLARLQELTPHDAQPAIKRAIVEQQRGNPVGRDDAIRRALELSHGKTRAAVAFLGARLILASARSASGWPGLESSEAPASDRLGLPKTPASATLQLGSAGPAKALSVEDSAPPTASSDWNQAKDLLRTCLHEQLDHAEALCCLAMVCAITNDQLGLIDLAARMDRPDAAQPRFHYLAAVCHLAAEDYPRALQACRRAQARADAALAVECEYQVGWAHLLRGDETAAASAFEHVAQHPSSPSANLARALAARLALARRDYDSAAASWKAIDARQRAEWGLDEPLRQTVFLSALVALQTERFEEAVDKLREAGRLGLRDHRLGSLLTLSLMKAGQRLLYQEEEAPAIYRVLDAT
jgi:tetratricopeptide (TPR) repeat protein